MAYALRSRSVLVTGGSRGLGAATCRAFAREGCNVIVNYVSSEKRGQEVVESLQNEFGVKAEAVQADVGDAKQCERLVAEATKILGGLDIVVNNAGWTRHGDFKDLDALTEAEWDKCWSVNVKSNLHLLRAAKPTFNTNPDGGVFLMTSSVAGLRPSGSSIAYSVSKAAGLQLMHCLASSQGPKIRVNAIVPGLMETEWIEGFPQEKVDAMKKTAVLKKTTSVEDCADAFVMMAKADSMTGAELKIDAGLFP